MDSIRPEKHDRSYSKRQCREVSVPPDTSITWYYFPSDDLRYWNKSESEEITRDVLSPITDP